jgi:hypothetical protein
MEGGGEIGGRKEEAKAESCAGCRDWKRLVCSRLVDGTL